MHLARLQLACWFEPYNDMYLKVLCRLTLLWRLSFTRIQCCQLRVLLELQQAIRVVLKMQLHPLNALLLLKLKPIDHAAWWRHR